MESDNLFVEETAFKEGSGTGCQWVQIEKQGLSIYGYNSIDEHFLGVNVKGTAVALEDYILWWNIEVYHNDELLCEDSREMKIKELRPLGSLGTFYDSQERDKIVESYQLRLYIRLYKSS